MCRAGDTGGMGAGGGGGGGPPPPPPPPPPTFLRSKKKKGGKGKKKKGFKAETIKSLPPRLKYYCFNHSRASTIRKIFLSANHGGRQYFSVFYGPQTLKSISQALMWLFEHSYFNLSEPFFHLHARFFCVVSNALPISILVT